MQEHYDNPGTGATAESTLDELFGTLWAISVITPDAWLARSTQ